MERQLLREWHKLEYTPALLNEDRDKNGGKLMLSGIIQKANTKNQNKRVYSRKLLEREFENYMKAVRENRALGEMDHPDSSTVSLEKVSHLIREMWWDGDNICGKLEVLDTPRGKIAQSLLDAGVTLGISSRGVGSTEKTNEGIDMVQDDYQLICFDLVGEPSTPGAYLQISEGRTVDGPRFSRVDRIYRALNDIVMG